jgi:hypothetical protein
MFPDTSGALCHLVRWADAFLQSSAASYELPALPRVSAQAVVTRDGLRKATAPHNFETVPSLAVLVRLFVFAMLVASLAISCVTSQ